MDSDSGCTTVVMAFGSILAIIAIVVLGLGWIGGQVGEAVQDARISLANAKTEQAQARADALQARADAERERTAQDRETNLHRETMFYSWTVALAGWSANNQGLLVVLAGALGALGAYVGISTVEARWARG